LQKKVGLLESDVNARKDRSDGLAHQAKEFEESGHFDAANIRAKFQRFMQRYENLNDPLSRRKGASCQLPLWFVAILVFVASGKLAESLKCHQLFRDIEDELAWIREKEQIATSANRGMYLVASMY